MPLPAIGPALAAAGPWVMNAIKILVAYHGISVGTELLQKYLSGEIGLAELQQQVEAAKAAGIREATGRLAEDERRAQRMDRRISDIMGSDPDDTRFKLQMIGAGVSPLIADSDVEAGTDSIPVADAGGIDKTQLARMALPNDVTVFDILSHFAGLDSSGVKDPVVFDILAGA